MNVGFCWCSEGLRVVVRRYPFRIPVIRNRDRKSLLIMNLSSYPMFICRAALGLCRLVNLFIVGALRDTRESPAHSFYVMQVLTMLIVSHPLSVGIMFVVSLRFIE